jgi:transposase-like protein
MSRQNREEMIARVDEWRRSSMSVETFARASGIPKSTFKYWIRKLRDKTKPADAFPGFIEMRQLVPAKPLPEAKAKTDILAKPQIVLTFPSGLCLKIYG